MNLYLLSDDPAAVAVCERAADGHPVSIEGFTSADQVPLQSPELNRTVLIVHADYALNHLDAVKTLMHLPFFRTAVLAPDPSATSELEANLGTACEVISAVAQSSLRFRIADWAAVDVLTHQACVQADRIKQVSGVLKTSSEDVTELTEKIAFLDRQREKLASVLETMNTLSRLSQEINCLDLDEIITVCVTKIPLLVNARYASLYLHNYRDATLELKRHNHGYRIDDVVRVTADSKSAMCRALLEKRILLIRDFEEYERLNGVSVERPNAHKYSSRSAIIAPMLAGDRVVAVLNLADKRSGEPFDEVNDLPPIEQLSVLVGAAIRNWQLFEEVKVQAKTDTMTGFINHQTFFEELEREVLRVRRYRGPLSVLMVDVDNFKLINDVYGHQLGDHILMEVSRIIKLNVRDTDIPARYGGDEFAVILSQADVTRARLVAERIREMVDARTFTYEDKKINLSLSIGVAQYRPAQTVADFVTEADKALYDAKAHGRNRVEAHAPA